MASATIRKPSQPTGQPQDPTAQMGSLGNTQQDPVQMTGPDATQPNYVPTAKIPGLVPSGSDINSALGLPVETGTTGPGGPVGLGPNEPVPGAPSDATGGATGAQAGTGGVTPLQGPMAAQTAAPVSGGSALNQQISSLLNNPQQWNSQVVNNRVESAREDLEGQRSAEMDTLMAQLAERGLLGDGPEGTALMRQGENLSKIFSGSVRDIYSDMADKGDQQIVELLSLSTGMSIAEAQNAVAMYQAQTNRDLGFGRLNQDWDEFSANYGLDQQKMAHDFQQDDITALIDFFRTLFGRGQ